MQPAPHEGKCRLVRTVGGQLLEDVRTGERIFFELEGEESWRLLFEGGMGFLTKSGTTLSLSEVFEFGLRMDSSGRLFVVEQGAEPVQYREWANQNIMQRLTLASDDGHAKGLRFYRFERLQHGSRLWWALPALQVAMALTQQAHRTARWLHNHWKDWLWFLSQFNFAPIHLRKAAEVQGDAPERCLPEQTCSTPAMLALLAHWAHSSKTDDIRQGATTVLQLLLRRVLGNVEASVCICLDKATSVEAGITPYGHEPLEVQVIEAKFDFSPLVALDSQLAEVVWTFLDDRLAPGGPQISCHAVLICIDKGGKPWRWLQRQLVTQLATLLEEDLVTWGEAAAGAGGMCCSRAEQDVADALSLGRALLGVAVPPGDAAVGGAEPPAKRMRNSVQYHHSLRQQSVGPRGKNFVPQHWQPMVCRYWMASRKHLRCCHSVVVVVVVDASNVGCKETLLSVVIGRKEGSDEWIALHGPPQDDCLGVNCRRLGERPSSGAFRAA